MSIARYLVWLPALWLLTGCAVSRISPEDPAAFVPDRSPEVVIGKTERAGVRAAFGLPQLSSSYWGFDLFRTDAEQTEIVFAITPWPIPFARLKDRIQRYTLVTYDSHGLAQAITTGLFRRPSSWRRTFPIRSDYLALHLRAGELLLYVDPEGASELNLLAAPRGRNAFLTRARELSQCTTVLGCRGGGGCPDQVSVDESPESPLPLRTAHAYWFRQNERDSWLRGVEPDRAGTGGSPWLESVVAFRLASGEHNLEFSARHLGGKTSFSFMCAPGSVTYVWVGASRQESFFGASLRDWQVDRSGTMPEEFVRRPLVLLNDGQWVVEAEPFD